MLRDNATNCRLCSFCEPMINLITKINLYRCYGEKDGVPLKKDFGEGLKEPPTDIEWCPNKIGGKF